MESFNYFFCTKNLMESLNNDTPNNSDSRIVDFAIQLVEDWLEQKISDISKITESIQNKKITISGFLTRQEVCEIFGEQISSAYQISNFYSRASESIIKIVKSNFSDDHHAIYEFEQGLITVKK